MQNFDPADVSTASPLLAALKAERFADVKVGTVPTALSGPPEAIRTQQKARALDPQLKALKYGAHAKTVHMLITEAQYLVAKKYGATDVDVLPAFDWS